MQTHKRKKRIRDDKKKMNIGKDWDKYAKRGRGERERRVEQIPELWEEKKRQSSMI